MEPLTPEELRVVACLVEKQFTTPDSYPLTENAVVSACNQLSNRNPVVAYDNNTVRVTLTALRQRGMARVIHTPGARVPKHRQILDDALELSRGEVSLLAVLALRGPQTVGELRTRTERMHDFASLSEVEETLEGLATRDDPLVVRLERQPGQKEARFAQLLGGPVDAAAHASDERADRYERADRADRYERAERSDDRGERADRSERAERADRYERAERSDDRGERADRSERAERADRYERAERSDDRGERADRYERGERSDDRGERSDERAERSDDRGERSDDRSGDRPSPSPVRPDRVAALEERLAAVEAELAILGAEHRELRAELGLGARPAAPEPE